MTPIVRDRIYFPELTDDLREQLEQATTHRNPQHWKLKQMRKPTWAEPAEIKTFVDPVGPTSECFSVPRGLLHRMPRFRDERFTRPLETTFHSKLNPYEYQRAAVAAALEKEQGILRLPTASGKTSIALRIAAETRQQTLVLVDQKALVDEWVLRAESELELSDGSPVKRAIGRYGGGSKQIAPLTIATEQSLHAMKEKDFAAFVSHFGAVIADEIQVFAAPTFMRTIDRIPAKYRIGVSADHQRPDGKHFLIEDVFGEVIYEQTRKDLETGGFVVGVNVRLFRTAFKADWYRKAKTSAGKLFTKLMTEMVEDDARTACCVDLVARRAQEGATILGFSDRVDHCHRIRDLLGGLGVQAGLLVAGPTQAQAIASMKAGKLRVGIGTLKAIGKGVNVPAADVGVLFTPVRSRQPFGQVRGRLARKGKASAELLVAWDWQVFGDKMVRDLRKWNGGCELLLDEGGMISATEYLRGKKTT